MLQASLDNVDYVFRASPHLTADEVKKRSEKYHELQSKMKKLQEKIVDKLKESGDTDCEDVDETIGELQEQIGEAQMHTQMIESEIRQERNTGKVQSQMMTEDLLNNIDRLAQKVFKKTWMLMGSVDKRYQKSLREYRVGVCTLIHREYSERRGITEDERLVRDTMEGRMMSLTQPGKFEENPLPLPTSWVMEKMKDILRLTPLSWKEVCYIYMCARTACCACAQTTCRACAFTT
jgi:hypothetical protein